MKLALRRRAPTKTSAAGDEVSDPGPPIGTAAGVAGTNVSVKLASAALLGCLAAGPLALVVAGTAVLSRDPVAATQPAPVDPADERTAAGEFAQRLVVAWLTSTRDHPQRLTELMPTTQLGSLPQAGFEVANPAVASISRAGQVWSVTVAVTVTDQRAAMARRFFQVPVTVAGDTVAALTLPAAVAGPAVGAGAPVDYRVPVAGSGPVATTVAQFLAAYVAGSGEVNRYVSPGASITPVAPAPYTAVRVTSLYCEQDIDTGAVPVDGAQLRVLATGQGTVTDTQSSTLMYALTLASRAGRWEVFAIDPAPVLAHAGAAAASTGHPAGPASTPTGISSPASP